jgi:TRAP-type C4-dicarboxylate transport system permease large subunit
MNLFFASYAFKKPLREIFRETWPFFALQLLVLVLVTYLPWLSTFLLPK